MNQIYHMLNDVDREQADREQIPRVELTSEEKERIYQTVLAGSGRTAKKRSIGKWVTAAASAGIVLIGSATVYAAVTHQEFFEALFGNSTKGNIEAHTEEAQGRPILDENGEETGEYTTYMDEFPAREFVEVDAEQAEELIGEQVEDTPTQITVGDHVITVESIVYDSFAADIYYTIEREGGVTMLYADQTTNEAKGAVVPENTDSIFYFCVNGEAVGGKRWIDLSKSTEDKYYCYEYMILNDIADSKEGSMQHNTEYTFQIVTDHYPMPTNEFAKQAGSMNREELSALFAQVQTETYSLPAKQAVDLQIYRCLSNDSRVDVSPISLTLFSSEDMTRNDPPAYVSITYKDGTEYIVHSWRSDGYIDNTGYICGAGYYVSKEGRTYTNRWTYVFNRLVDPDEIAQIEIHDLNEELPVLIYENEEDGM